MRGWLIITFVACLQLSAALFASVGLFESYYPGLSIDKDSGEFISVDDGYYNLSLEYDTSYLTGDDALVSDNTVAGTLGIDDFINGFVLIAKLVKNTLTVTGVMIEPIFGAPIAMIIQTIIDLLIGFEFFLLITGRSDISIS